MVQQLVQAPIGAACADKIAPGADQLLDRGERAPHQDRGGDHRAGRQAILDHQIRAQPQDQRLHADAHELGNRPDHAGAVAGPGLQRQHAVVHLAPALAQRRQHAQGMDHFRIHQLVIGKLVGFHRHGVGIGQQFFGGPLHQKSHRQQDHDPGQGKPAQPRMQEKTERQVDRRPRRIEKGGQPGPGQKLAQIGQVGDGLPRVAAAFVQDGLKGRREDVFVDFFLQARAGAHQQARAHPFQQAHQYIHAQDQAGQHHQGRNAAAGQHPVVNLQHVDRRRQHQGIDAEAEQRNHRENMAQLAPDAVKFGLLGFLLGHGRWVRACFK